MAHTTATIALCAGRTVRHPVHPMLISHPAAGAREAFVGETRSRRSGA